MLRQRQCGLHRSARLSPPVAESSRWLNLLNQVNRFAATHSGCMHSGDVLPLAEYDASVGDRLSPVRWSVLSIWWNLPKDALCSTMTPAITGSVERAFHLVEPAGGRPRFYPPGRVWHVPSL
jgi:hypothetical protein